MKTLTTYICSITMMAITMLLLLATLLLVIKTGSGEGLPSTLVTLAIMSGGFAAVLHAFEIRAARG